MTKTVDQLIATNENPAGLMTGAQSFPGWERFGAFLSQLEFAADHHRQIERIAVNDYLQSQQQLEGRQG